jgi:cytochrome P450
MEPLLISCRIVNNAYKLCFWAMAYLLFDPPLFVTIKMEIKSAHCDSLPGLETRLEECPRLMAFYEEVLRLATASASIRTTEADTSLGNVTLRAGGKVLLHFRQLHFNEKVFGDNAGVFNLERFLKNRNLSKSPSFRPF